MKHFLRKIVVFLVILLCYFGINGAINIWFYSKQSFEVTRNIMIVGDSGPQKSLNPKYFQNAQNICQVAEPYVLTYWKLKKILESSKIDTVILGFLPHNISEFNDLKFTNKKWSSEMFRRSYSIEHFKDIDNKIGVDYPMFYKTFFKQVAFYPKKNQLDYIGKYSNNESNNLSGIEKEIKRHYYLDGKQLGISNLAISYLDSIVNLTNSKNIELVLVGVPIYEEYLNEIPSSIMEEYYLVMNKYKGKLIIIDKMRTSYPAALYRDATHLNKFGATRFSKEVLKSLKSEKH